MIDYKRTFDKNSKNLIRLTTYSNNATFNKIQSQWETERHTSPTLKITFLNNIGVICPLYLSKAAGGGRTTTTKQNTRFREENKEFMEFFDINDKKSIHNSKHVGGSKGNIQKYSDINSLKCIYLKKLRLTELSIFKNKLKKIKTVNAKKV